MQYNSHRARDNTLAEKKTQAAFGQFQTQRTNPPWTLVFQIAAISAGNRQLNVAVGPDHGPPLLLLHGVTRGWSDWSTLLGDLTLRWRVVAVDFRGHGGSDSAAAGYCVADYVDDAVTVLRQVTAEPAVVMGHSLGAMVALHAAAEAPDLVRAVVAEDPPFHTMGSRIASTPLLAYFCELQRLHRLDCPLAEFALRLAEVSVGANDDGDAKRLGDVRDMASLRMAAAFLKQVDPEVFEPIVAGRWLDGYDVEGVLARVRCPTLLLQADPKAGGMLTDADLAFAERTVKECYSVRFPGVGHLIHWTDPVGTSRPVLALLESLRVGEERTRVADGRAESSAGRTYRVDGHETRSRHDTHQKRPVG